jgi:C-terminal processing protease CtpA/Prc
VVDAVIQQMNSRYVFPEVARKVEAGLRAKLRAHAFDGAASGEALAEQLTGELLEITHDKHIRVEYSEEPLPPRTDAQPSAEEKAAIHEMERQHNFGVERVERLPFNIGYIDLRGFADLAIAGDTITAAMTLVAGTDALIVDLRQNHGGEPSTVAFTLSYLFDQRTHVNDLYWREGGRTEQYWTQDWVPGKRFGQGKPLYVLTSGQTFSGGEEFAYDLKNLKRATLVGEVTGGGANPGDSYQLTPHFEMFVPTGRAVSPVTHTNWEGTGVQPDVRVEADRALDVAQSLLLKQMLSSERDPRRQDSLQRRLESLDKPAATK